MPDYGEANYWDDRYTKQKNQTFDWLEGWNDVKEIIETNAVDGLIDPFSVPVSQDMALAIKKNCKTLNLGCGNSIMCEDMYDEGYTQIENMDISEVCINYMAERNKESRP